VLWGEAYVLQQKKTVFFEAHKLILLFLFFYKGVFICFNRVTQITDLACYSGCEAVDEKKIYGNRF
jgi:hypothetical protein